MLKVVIDTNVWVSALISSHGKPRQLVSLIQQTGFAFFYPEQLIKELREAPKKSRLAPLLSHLQIERLIVLIERKASLVELEGSIAVISRDPGDDPFLACAQAVESDFLVTGDKDLLVLKSHGRTKIVTPADFLLLFEPSD